MSSCPSKKQLKQVLLSSAETGSPSTPNTTSSTTAFASSTTKQETSSPPASVTENSPIGAEPFHPPADFKFPRSDKRSCQARWFTQWKWHHYDEEKNVVRCFTCVSAVEKKLMPPQRRHKKSETALTVNGFQFWKNGPDQFHMNSLAAEKLLASRQKKLMRFSVSERSKCLEKIFSAIILAWTARHGTTGQRSQ